MPVPAVSTRRLAVRSAPASAVPSLKRPVACTVIVSPVATTLSAVMSVVLLSSTLRPVPPATTLTADRVPLPAETSVMRPSVVVAELTVSPAVLSRS